MNGADDALDELLSGTTSEQPAPAAAAEPDAALDPGDACLIELERLAERTLREADELIRDSLARTEEMLRAAASTFDDPPPAIPIQPNPSLDEVMANTQRLLSRNLDYIRRAGRAPAARPV